MNTQAEKSFNSLPLLLFIFSFLLRVNLISTGPYHIDSLNLAIQAEKTFQTHQLHHLFGFGYPLTVLLGAVFIFISRIFSLQDPVFSVNLMSVFFSSLCVPALFLIGKKLFNSTAGLLAALLLNVLPIFLGLSIYGTSHTPCLFFLLIGIYLLVRHLENHKFLTLMISAIAVGLMGACRIQDLILMSIPISSLLLWKSFLNPKTDTVEMTNQSIIKRFAFFWIIVGGVAILFHLPLMGGEQLNSYQGQFRGFVNQAIGPNFRGFFSPSLFRSLVFTNFNLFPAGILISALGFILILRQKPKTFLFLFLWMIIPLAFYGNLHSTAPRFLLLSTVPLLLAIGYFFCSIPSIPKGNTAETGFPKMNAVIFFILLHLMFASIFPVVLFRHRHALLPDFARWIEKETEENALIIAGDENFFIQNYTRRKILYKPANAFAFRPGELSDFKTRLDEILTENTPVYIDHNGLYSYDADALFSDLIKNNYRLAWVGENLIEEWYPGEIFLDIQRHSLFKIFPKPKN